MYGVGGVVVVVVFVLVSISSQIKNIKLPIVTDIKFLRGFNKER
jgi:hypothetical protein